MELMDLEWLEWWEMLSYVVTVLGLPAAIFLYFRDNERERLAEQQEIDGQLKEEYNDILDNLIEHPELDHHDAPLKGEQALQQARIYQKLIGCFETSFIRLYDRPERELQRMWYSWQDIIDEWLRQPNFAQELPKLLVGEDENFAIYMKQRLQAKD
jgi:hypothetical protein